MNNTKYKRLYEFLLENDIEYQQVNKSGMSYRLILKNRSGVRVDTYMGIDKAIDLLIEKISCNL